MKSLKYNGFEVIFLLPSMTELNLIIQKPLKRQWEKLIFVTNKVKREKAYLTRRIREQVTLIRREKVLSLIKVLEIALGISLKVIIKEKILRIKHSKIIHHQKAGICLTIMLK